MYCGCSTVCGRLTWCFSILFLLAATVALALGLYFTVPCTRTLVACNPAANSACWSEYMTCTSSSAGLRGVYFFLSCAGVVCLLLSLLTCCCFCCQRNPRKKAQKQDQFIAGSSSPTPAGTSDATPAGYTDQYGVSYAAGYQAYDPYTGNKPSVARV